MKKIVVYIMLALSFTFATLSHFNGENAWAVQLAPGSVELEISKEGNTLPALKLDGNASFLVQIFDVSDIGFNSPLSSGLFYTFNKLGEYKVRYTVVSTNGTSYLYSTVNAIDTEAPTVAIKKLKSEYGIGDEVRIKADTADKSGLPVTVSYSLFLNGTDISKEINGSIIKIKDQGDYRVLAVATDTGGNRAEDTVEFSVLSGSSDGCGAWGGWLLLDFGFAVGFGILILILFRKKKEKSKKEKELSEV